MRLRMYLFSVLLLCIAYMILFDQGYNYLARLQACQPGKMGNQNMSTSPLYSLCILSICLPGFHFHFSPFDYLEYQKVFLAVSVHDKYQIHILCTGVHFSLDVLQS